MQLSLLVTYRDRPHHLDTQLHWWQQAAPADCELVLVEAAATPTPGLGDRLAQLPRSRYYYLPCPGIFHKTRALNAGLAQARGDWIAAFDVDLIPLGATLERHLAIAQSAPRLLVSGYRLLCPTPTLDWTALPATVAAAEIAPEDRPTALRKHLTQGERFGVVPLLQRERLVAIGGWDAGFVGWGGEDQDLIERYLADGRHFCRSPELVYLHLAHERDRAWAEAATVAQNRAHYYAKRATARRD